MGISIQGGSARRYEAEYAKLRWEDEQKREQITGLIRRNEQLEQQLAKVEAAVDLQEAATARTQSEMLSRSKKMCGSLFAGHEKMLLKNCFAAWCDFALHEVAAQKLSEEMRRKDRELRERSDRIKAQRIKIASLEEEAGRLSSALQAEREKYGTAKDHQELLTAQKLRAAELAAQEKERELVHLEKSAMAAATHLGIRIPRSMLTQEEYLQKGAKGTF